MYKEAVSSVRATRHESRRFNSAIYFKFFNQISTYYNRLISHLNIQHAVYSSDTRLSQHSTIVKRCDDSLVSLEYTARYIFKCEISLL